MIEGDFSLCFTVYQNKQISSPKPRNLYLSEIIYASRGLINAMQLLYLLLKNPFIDHDKFSFTMDSAQRTDTLYWNLNKYHCEG